MTLQQVPMGSMAGMAFSLILCVGAPILLAILVQRKLKGGLGALLLGAVVFIVSALILEQTCHRIVFQVAGDALNGNIWLYALYGAVMAAAFEEFARYFAMKNYLKKRNLLNRQNALMYGVGHGGIESILVAGMAQVSNLVTSFMVNNGSIEASLSALDDATREAAMESLQKLWGTGSALFFLSGIERVLAIAFQIALSVLVYRAVSLGRRGYFLMALGMHFAVDFIVVVAAQKLSPAVAELFLLAMVAAAAYFAYVVLRDEKG